MRELREDKVSRPEKNMTLPPHGGNAGERQIRLDFSANLNPIGMPDCVKQAVLDSVQAWEHYPDPYCSRLRRMLAERIGSVFADERQTPGGMSHPNGARDSGMSLSESLFRRIVIGNGADDLIFRIVQALHPKQALLAAPTFSEYENALRQNGCAVAFYKLCAENDFDLTSDILPVITNEMDLLFLCSPNNPTGRLIDPALLEAIVRRCADCGVMLVIDECFLPFVPDGADRSALRFLCGNPEGSREVSADESYAVSADDSNEASPADSLASSVDESYAASADDSFAFSVDNSHAAAVQRSDSGFADHVIVLNAFTKIFSMPGLRLGWCVCGSADIADRIQESGQFWSVSAPALAAGEAALKMVSSMSSKDGTVPMADGLMPLADKAMPQAGGMMSEEKNPMFVGFGDYINQSIALISRERTYLAAGLRAAGLCCIPSQVNFILCRGKLPLYERLLREGILIRDCSNFRGLGEGWYRIAVRTHAENEELLNVISYVNYRQSASSAKSSPDCISGRSRCIEFT